MNAQSANDRLLTASRAKDKARRLGWGFLASAALLEALLCFALLDYSLVLSPRMRVGGFVVLCLLLIMGVAGWLKLHGRPTPIKEAALDAEAKRPDLGCVVSTAAEYITGARAVTHEYEPELVAALKEQAGNQLQRVQFSYSEKLFRPAGMLAFSLLTILLFAAAAPVALIAFKRTVTPWSKETYTKVQVAPGNSDIPLGSDLEVTNLFSGRAPKDATLHWTEMGQTNWQSASLEKSDVGLYFFRFRDLQQPVRYQVTGNDACSEIYEITTYVPPEVRAFSIEIAYPEYSRVKPFHQEVPELKVLRASDLSFSITPSVKLARARLRFSSLPPVDLAPGEDGQWTGHFKAAKDAVYWIELADAKGHQGGNEQPYHLKVLPDKPPKVAVIDPGHDIRAEASNTIPVKIAASDDFGIVDLKLVYHRLGGPEQSLKCAFTNSESGEFTGGVEIALAGLGLQQYDLVAYHAEATDNNTLDGPGKGASQLYFIEITNDEGAKQKAMTNQNQVNLLSLQKEIIAETSALGPKAASEEFADLAARQKEAADFAGIYQKSLARSGAPADATRLMQDAVAKMKTATGALQQRTRAPALPAEESALVDLYQVLKTMPKLGNLPTQPPLDEQQPPPDPAVQAALETIKKEKKELPPNEELAQALENAKQLARSQAGLLQAAEKSDQPEKKGQQETKARTRPRDTKRERPKAEAAAAEEKANPEAKDSARTENNQGQNEKGDQQGKNQDAGKSDEQKGTQQEADKQGQGQQEAKGEQQGQGQQAQGQQQGQGQGQAQGKPGENPGEGQPGAQAKAGKKPGTAKPDQTQSPAEKQDQQANAKAQAGTNPAGGKPNDQNPEEKPGEPKPEPGQEGLAEQEDALSKEAADLAEKLQELAHKDTRLNHAAAKKANEAAGHMGAAAQSLRKGEKGAAGTEGGQGLQELNMVVASLERVLKEKSNRTDVAEEDFPKEYEALISDYLRKLSHEQ